MPMDDCRQLLQNKEQNNRSGEGFQSSLGRNPAVTNSCRHLDGVHARMFPSLQEGSRQRMDKVTTEPAPMDAEPFFDVHMFVCCNRRPDGHTRGSCAARGSEALRDYMKARVKEAKIPHARVNMAGCLDRCEDGPCIVIYPAGVWYRIESRQDVDAVIEQHLIGGRQAAALRLPVGRPA
jgi:(2Fe-2S) ferredoxin